MIGASDQCYPSPPLSPISSTIVERKDEIINCWETRVRSDIPAARNLSQAILTNTIPVFLTNLAEALTPAYPRAMADSGTTVAVAHGNERSRVTNYNPADIVAEYYVLRDCLYEVLGKNRITVGITEREIIYQSIYDAIKTGLSEYSAEQLSARQSYVATLAHDLLNPLSVIKNAAMVAKKSNDPEKVKWAIEKVESQVDRSTELVRELLDTAASKSDTRLTINPEEFDIQVLLREVADQLPPGTSYAITGEPVKGCWSKKLMYRALDNLFRNAHKYGNGSIITANTMSRYGRVLISIHNEGDPIDIGEIEQIFEMFKRGSSQKSTGWGIGLPFVKNVAESHGGSVMIDSSEERGTTVTLDVPIALLKNTDGTSPVITVQAGHSPYQ